MASLGSGADTSNIRLGVSNLDITTRLTNGARVALLPETFGFSDLLRGPLCGIGDGIDRANVQRIYGDALAAIPTTPCVMAAPTIEPRIDVEITNRAFQCETESRIPPAIGQPSRTHS